MISKIGIMIPEVRQIDYYCNFLSGFNKDDLVIIVNDSDKSVGDSIFNNKKLKKYNKKYLSDIMRNNEKFEYIISTGNFRVPIRLSALKQILWICDQIIKFIYSRFIGAIFQASGLSAKLEKYFKRPFDAGGLNRTFHPARAEFVERMIGRKNILFPRGMDINSKTYPSSEFIRRFDIFLCHGNKDYELVRKKTNAPTFKIGYPRYQLNHAVEKDQKALIKEFKLCNEKITLLWMPSRLDWENPKYRNIKDWLPSIGCANSEIQIIVRPHPHLIKINPELIKELKEYRFHVDSLKSRNLSALYSTSDIVIADYGGSIFSGLYMKKPVILLNSANHDKVLKSNELDISLRHRFTEFNLKDSNELELLLNTLDHDKINKLNALSNSLRSEIFGENNFQEFYDFINNDKAMSFKKN